MKPKTKTTIWIVALSLAGFVSVLLAVPAWAQVRGKEIVVDKSDESLDEKFQRMITLDVREMNIVDVIKFLSLKGDFNMVTSGEIQGRVTLYLKNVSIADAFDIVLISNTLAYYVENNIVQVMTALDFEAMFGRRFNDKLEVEIINLQYARPSYISAALDNLKSSLGRTIIDEDTGSLVLIDTRESLDKMKKAIQKMERPAEIFVFPLQFAKADVVSEKLLARIDGNAVGSITTDERSNRLIIRALPGRRQEVEEMIRSLDVPVKEVLIEAKIMQIIFKPEYDMGIDWQKNFPQSSDQQIRKVQLDNFLLNESGLSSSDSLSSTFGRIILGDISADHFEMTVRALKQVSDTKILSNPKLLVTNNEEAKIHIGDTVPYIISTTSGTGDNAITSEDVRFVDVGLKLDVTPTINDEGIISMRLKPEISTVATTISSQGGGIPQVNKTEVETTVMVKDGMTIILGGLKKDNKVHVKKSVPFLGELPIFEKFFSRTDDEIEITEIVIFITPRIIDPTKSMIQGGMDDGGIKPSKMLHDIIEPDQQVLRLKE